MEELYLFLCKKQNLFNIFQRIIWLLMEVLLNFLYWHMFEDSGECYSPIEINLYLVSLFDMLFHGLKHALASVVLGFLLQNSGFLSTEHDKLCRLCFAFLPLLLFLLYFGCMGFDLCAFFFFFLRASLH